MTGSMLNAKSWLHETQAPVASLVKLSIKVQSFENDYPSLSIFFHLLRSLVIGVGDKKTFLK